MRKWWLLLVPLGAIFAVVSCQGPRIDVVPFVEGNRVVFDIPRSGINGLLGIIVEDEAGHILWKVNLKYYNGRQITYGEMPRGSKQVIPADGSTPPDIRGRRVQIQVEYQYDEFMAPSAACFVKSVQVP